SCSVFFFSSRRRHTRCYRDWSSDVCSSDLHFWSVKRQVTVDECAKCEGVFLDPGELAEIRSEYRSEDERRKAASAYYREMFDTQLAGMLKPDKAKLENARKIANIFKFICPSFYLPGKQDWGAF